jgi:hypothetical protein
MSMTSLYSPFHVRLCAGFAITLGTLLPQTAARAQSEGGYDLLLEIVEAINSVSEETAREAHAKCLGISKKLADRKDIADIQRLYFEGMILSCISYAMNNGQFSDATGDQCSHQFDYASKLSQVVKLGEGKPEFAAQLPNIKDTLDGAIRSDQSVNCPQDFEALKIQ